MTDKRRQALTNTQKNIDDERYTYYDDIKKEVLLYTNEFKGKVVYCPCDNPYISNFYRFFCDYFDVLQLKKVIATWYNGCIIEYDGERVEYSFIYNDGDFRKQSIPDGAVVCTNPPFSLFKYLPEWADGHKVLLVCHKLAFTYKSVWVAGWHAGQNNIKYFFCGDKVFKIGGAFYWATNMTPDAPYSRKKLCIVPYDKDKHKPVENYDNMINTDSIFSIPDYGGIVACPINIVLYDTQGYRLLRVCDDCYVEGKCKFKRVLIQKS